MQKSQKYEHEVGRDRFLITTYNILLGVKQRFAGIKQVQEQVDLEQKMQFETDREGTIIEISNIIGDIVNIISQEIRQIELKDQLVAKLEYETGSLR